jgi:outer membrane protein assembly factor BamB
LVAWEPERGASAGLSAFDVTDGALRWTAPLRAGGVSAPVVISAPGGSPLTVVVDADLAAKAFDLADGARRWAVPVGGAGAPEVPPLALSHGGVLVADRLAGLTLVDGDGKQVWTTRVDGAAIQGGPVGPTLDGRYALPLVDGQVLLAGPDLRTSMVQPPGGVANGVAATGATLYVTTARGPANQLVRYASDESARSGRT